MIIDLHSFILQSPTTQIIDLSDSGWIMGGITAVILTITFAYNIHTTKQNTRARFAQLINDFATDLEKHKEKESSLKTTEDCKRYADNYLNILDRMAHLYLNDDEIPERLLLFFKEGFRYGLTLREWYVKNTEFTIDELKESWDFFDRWCSLRKYDARLETELPKLLVNFKQLKQKEDMPEIFTCEKCQHVMKK